MSAVKRDLSIDLAKVLSTLLVVAVWHLPSYGHVFNPEEWRAGGYITLCAMSIFMFFSGYCQNKYHFGCANDYLLYYKRRLKRFYVLYFSSLVLLYVVTGFTDHPWFDSNVQFMMALIGMSSFVKPEVMTLWFMSMLMLFYILTPVIKGQYHTVWPSLFISSILYALFWGIQLRYHSVDWRLLVLFPVCVIGLTISPKIYNKVIASKYSIWLLAMGFIIVFLPAKNTFFFEIERVLCICCFIIGASSICTKISSIISAGSVVAKSITVLSYCSLAIYLFHREIYQGIYMFCYRLNIPISLFTYYLLFVPLAIIMAYYIQRGYDMFCNRLQGHRELSSK